MRGFEEYRNIEDLKADEAETIFMEAGYKKYNHAYEGQEGGYCRG